MQAAIADSLINYNKCIFMQRYLPFRPLRLRDPETGPPASPIAIYRLGRGTPLQMTWRDSRKITVQQIGDRRGEEAQAHANSILTLGS